MLANPFFLTSDFSESLSNSPCLRDASCDAWVTYGEVRARVHNLVASFANPSKNLVFCFLPRSLEGVLAYLAAAISGHAVAVVDIDLPHRDDVIEFYRPHWIVAPVHHHFSSYNPIVWPLKTLGLWRAATLHAYPIHPDLFLLLLTSGSTGGAKTVRLSYENINTNTAAIVSSLELDEGTCAINHLPLFYSFGLSVINSVIRAGGSCVLSEEGLFGRQLWKEVRKSGVNFFPGVPYHFEMISKLGLDRLEVPSLTTFAQAGGQMPSHLIEAFLNVIEPRRGKLFVMYGQTEAAPRMSCYRADLHRDKIKSVGKALEGGRFDVDDDEIVYTGPNVMMGYATTWSDLKLGDENSRILRTGDLGYLDGENYLYLTGRRSRFAKLFGQRLSLADIESVASETCPSVALEDHLKIVIFVETDDPFVCQKIRAAIVAQIKIQESWFEIRPVGALPHLPSGKIDFQSLKDKL